MKAIAYGWISLLSLAATVHNVTSLAVLLGVVFRVSTADRSRYSPADVERNTVIRHLHENGPATSRELPADVSGRAREVVARLSPLRTGGNGRKSRLTSPSMTVYYLYGDERRAVRKYIAEHTPAIRSCFEDHNSPLQQNLEDIIYQMFIEEWEWGEWS